MKVVHPDGGVNAHYAVRSMAQDDDRNPLHFADTLECEAQRSDAMIVEILRAFDRRGTVRCAPKKTLNPAKSCKLIYVVMLTP